MPINHTQIEQLLKEHGIRASYHRIKIYQYLVEKRNHPSVDMIYQDLIHEIPTLSRTTVYNALNLFMEKNLVIMITIAENETRYDANVDLHGHFRCSRCGKILDVFFNKQSLPIKGLETCVVQESHIYFKGYCPECQAEV